MGFTSQAFAVLLLLSISSEGVLSAYPEGRGGSDSWLGGYASSSGSGGRLRFRPDGTFTLLQLTDLHYGEGEALDACSDQVQRAVLEAERPDLVVFSGDMVSGWVCGSHPRPPPGQPCGDGWFEARWRQLTAPVQQAGIPYAVILGNHDAEAELSRRGILSLDIRSGGLLSQTRQGPPAATGASNYWLDVYPPLAGVAGSSAGADVAAAPAARIWLLDSNDRTCPPLMFGWGCVAEDTLSWLNATARSLPPAPSLAYVHIPLQQFMDVWADSATMGASQEDVSCSVRDTGLFQLAKDLGIHAVYVGHDHNNDYVGTLDGVRLAYGRKSGYGNYGPPDGWLHGARVVRLRLGEDTAYSETWIRQEDGSAVRQQPSRRQKAMRQLACHCDELGQVQPEAALPAAEPGAAASED